MDTSRAVPAAADYVRGLLAHEDEIGRWLEAHRAAVSRHPGVYAAVDRIRAAAIRHRESLVGHFSELGGAAPDSAGDPPPLAPPAAADATTAGGPHPVSDALTELQALLRRAAVAYQRLWVAASMLGSRPTFRLAAEHMRAYAAAAADLIPLLSEVMVWELREAGLDCRCTCAACADLGVCLCGPASAILMERAVRETAPAEPGGAPVWFVRYGSPAARAGIANGDLITDAAGGDVPDPWA
ncbi:MAG TPA: hypothetical protein VFX49_18795, partial [Chloroflexota bacterium]|nr:hypothetical protein [Chloroflexota bacterium]